MTLTGGDGDYPPTDEDGFLDGARTLRIPDLYEAITDAEPLGPIVGYRATENRLRHYERVRRWPEGLVALGDAVCALNPVYGQGMTTAALGAEVLDRCLRRSRAPQGIRLGTGRKFQWELRGQSPPRGCWPPARTTAFGAPKDRRGGGPLG